MRTALTVTAPLVAALACGCEETPAPQAPGGEAQAQEITRSTAVDMARRDAALRFSQLRVSSVNAQPVGKFWLMELRDPEGRGVRYGISKYDGSIRERTMVE